VTYFLLSLLIFLIPFVINPFFGYFFEPPKVIFAEVLIELIFLFVLFKVSTFLKALNKPQLILSLSLIGLTFVHINLIRNQEVFFGNQFRLQGIFLMWNLIVLFLLSSRLKLSNLPSVLFPVSLGFLLLATFLVEPDINGRMVGTLGEPNALAASAVFLWPFAFSFRLKKAHFDKLLKLAVISSVIAILVTSRSHSGSLAFLIQSLFLIFYKRVFSLKKTVSIALILILSSLVLPLFEGGGWYENRAEIWQTALFAGSQNVLGQGFGNIEHALSDAAIKLDNNIKFQSVDSAHNFLLDFWVQGGVVGLAIFLMIIFLSLKGLIRQNKVVEIATLLGLIVCLLFNPVSIATLVSFWFILGQGFNNGEL
jgi:hypothetical protein